MPRCRSLVVGLAAFGLAAVPRRRGQAVRSGTARSGRAAAGRDVRTLQRYLTPGRSADRGRRPVRAAHRPPRELVGAPFGVARVNGRVSRREARKLQSQVERGVRVFEPAPQPTARARRARRPRSAPTASPSRPRRRRQEVKDAIAAANKIVGKPYKYGGGHGRWKDSGYDCSGAMSYALHGGGLLNRQLTSGDFMSWGRRGKGSLDHGLRQQRPRLPRHRRPALRHRLEQRRQGPALERGDAPDGRLHRPPPQRL